MLKLRPGNIIFDMDEVLFNISPYMYKKIRLHWDEFLPFLKDVGPLTNKQIFDRPNFLLTDWLFRDDLVISPEGKKLVWETTNKAINTFCFNEVMYDRINPTYLCRNTLLNPNFINDPAIKSCTILTRTQTEFPGMKKAKEKIRDKFFKHPKINFVIVESSEKKSETIKKLNLDWSLMIDDEVKNIQDVAENFDLERREFLVPRFGYNKFPSEVAFLIKEKGGTLSFYDTVE